MHFSNLPYYLESGQLDFNYLRYLELPHLNFWKNLAMVHPYVHGGLDTRSQGGKGDPTFWHTIGLASETVPTIAMFASMCCPFQLQKPLWDLMCADSNR